MIKINMTYKKLAKSFQFLLILVILLLAGSLILSYLNTPIKYKIYSVDSGSMQPTIKIGSLVAVVTQQEYAQGDIITFRSENDPKQIVTHRISRVSRDEDLGRISYETKGDANEDPDPELLPSSRIVGKVVFNVPLLGYPISWSRTPTGFVALIVIPATLIIYSELNNIKNEIAGMIAVRKQKKQSVLAMQAVESESAEKTKKPKSPVVSKVKPKSKIKTKTKPKTKK